MRPFPGGDPDDDFDAEEDEAGTPPRLQLVLRFAAYVRRVAWFSNLGEPLSPTEIAVAEDYCSALGFPYVTPVLTEDWEEAESAVGNPDWNADAWEAEEALRAGLIAQALEEIEEDELTAALTAVTGRAAEVLHEQAAVAAARSGVFDQELIRAAAGAGVQGCYQAALVLAAGAGDDHPFAIRFRLFEAGRWPLGIVGSTFGVF